MAIIPANAPRHDGTTLSPTTIDKLQAALLRELDVHQRTAIEADLAVEDLAGHDIVDVGTTRELAEQTRRHALGVIAEIQVAFGRLEDGSYGKCEQCQTPIGATRLEAIPYARTCIDCRPAPSRPCR